MSELTAPAINFIELFAGAGGLAQGFERTGRFRAAALYDWFRPAKESYLRSRPEAKYRLGDIRDLDAEVIVGDLEGAPLHGVLGGPPCQGFSIAGKRQSDADTNELVRVYGRLIDELRPAFIVLENVPQLQFHKYFAPLIGQLEQHYFITFGVLNAARYGTPQTRHRLILMGYRKPFGVGPNLPRPTHGRLGQSLYSYNLRDSSARIQLSEQTATEIFGADPVITRVVQMQSDNIDTPISWDMLPLVTVGNAISDLDSAYGSHEPIAYATDAVSEYQEALRTTEGTVGNCLARKHVGLPLRIAQDLREGGTPSLEPGFIDRKYFSQAYARLHRDALARTVTTFFQNAGSGRFLHYEKPRTLTVREAARLQGFPDDFTFTGNLAEQMQQVGNAVPLPLASAVAAQVLAELHRVLLD